MVKLLKNPKLIEQENASYGYFKKGISLCTDRYRLIKYFRDNKPTIELYDHQIDSYETNNITDKNLNIITNLMPIWDKINTGLYEN